MAPSLTEVFEGERRRLEGVALRMLGTTGEAEEVLQDAWLRWDAALGSASPPPASGPAARAWLLRTVTRLAIDRLRERRRRERSYPGPWLPEPVLTDAPPESAGSLAESLSTAVLLLLERLGPEERAVFVLREAFGEDYASIAELLELRVATCRQHHHRAHKRLAAADSPPPGDLGAGVLDAFVAALESGDAARMRDLLTEDAVALHDGGGRVPAAVRPIEGAARIVQVQRHLFERQRAAGAIELRRLPAAGGWAIALLRDGMLDSVATFELAGERIARIYVQRNPGKLAAAAARLGLRLAA